MSPEVDNKIVEVLDYIRQGADFAKEQMPLVNEIVISERFNSIYIAGVLLIFMSVISFIGFEIYKSYKKERKTYMPNDLPGYILGMGACIAITTCLSIGIFAETHDFIQTFIAPRVIILENIQKLVK